MSRVLDEGIANVGFYLSNSFSLINNKLDFLLTGRYDKIVFDVKNLILEAQNDTRSFEAFTPKAALNYKFSRTVAAYTSYGLGFDTPAGNELDNYPTSSKPNSSPFRFVRAALRKKTSLNISNGTTSSSITK